MFHQQEPPETATTAPNEISLRHKDASYQDVLCQLFTNCLTVSEET